MAQAYVLLDRDGVINQDSDAYIKTPDEWQPIPGSIEAIALLNEHDFKVVVITNQSGLARGLYDRETLEHIHAKMLDLCRQNNAKIEAIFYCPHLPDDDCTCRKPKTGLLEQFSNHYQVDLNDIYFVGDTLKDIQAGQSVNARPLLVKTGKGLRTIADNPKIDVPIFKDLYHAAQFIISR